MRAGGRVPAILYGRNVKPENVELNAKEVEDLMHHSSSETILLDLAVRGEKEVKHLALVQDVQHHPLSGRVIHMDLHQVAENEKVTVSVPVETVGDAAGAKEGGILEHVLFKIRVRGLPKDLPGVVEVDVSHLNIGQAVHLGEIKLPPGCEAVGDKGIPVIALAAPITEAQEAAALEAATAPLAEPEMLKEKKEEGEEAAAEAGKPGEKPAKGAAPAAKPGEKAAEKAPEKAEKPEKKK